MSGILWQKADRPSNASSCFIIPSDAFNAFENIVGNGENAGNQHFLLFPQNFQHYQTQKS